MSEKILLVEDEAVLALSEQKMLQRHGYEVLTAHSGEQAIEHFDSDPQIDLVLMDIDLGEGMNGTDAAREILERHQVPVVFLTGHSEREYVDKAKEITSYGYVLKHSGELILLETISMAFKLFDAHRRTRESEEKYRAAFMTSPDSININRMDGLYVDINEGFSALTGYTREDVIGRLSSEIDIWAIPEDREKLVHGLRESGYVENLESVFRCKDGSLKTALMSARLIELSGEPHILSITRDITEKKRTEEELRRNEERYRSLFEHAADGILIGDNEGTITDANVSMTDLTGYTRDELVGKNISVLFDREEIEAKPLAYDVLYTGINVQRERRIRTKSGAKISVIMNSKRVDEDCLQAIFHDVSSLRRTEESLLRSEERFRLAIEGSRDGLWDWNLQTNEAFHSDRFATMLGYEPGELPYTGEAWSALLHPEDRDEALRRVDEHLQGKTEIYESVFRMRAKDGSYRWINGRGKATFDENGTPVRLVGFNTDITERIRKEEELRRTLDEKDYLLQELNHRVKNNLIMVSSLIQLKDNNLGEEVDLSDIARQVDAIRIIHEKLYQHKQTDHIDMRDYVQEILSTVFSYPSLNIRIENEVDHISLDTRTAVTVGLIVNEIATNAVKHGFTEGSEETFHAEMRRDGPDGSLFLELSNTGRPFPEDVDFENPDSLGLQLIHSLGAQLDGRLELRKEPYPVFTLSFSSE